MNTYIEGGVDITWFRDYCQLSEHIESAQIILSSRLFSTKFYKTSNLYYSEIQGEVILFLEVFKEEDIVIYFELVTKSKINHFIETIQSDQQSLKVNSLNDKDELRNRNHYLGNYFHNTNPDGAVRLHYK